MRREVTDIRYKKLKDLLFRVEYDEINELKTSLITELESVSPNQAKIQEIKEQLLRLENIHHLDHNELENLNNTGWGSNEDGDEEQRLIFGKKIFDFPKPSKLIIKLFASTLFKKGIFLDSFAGTGTSAHAVLQLNKIDGGKRNFILVELEDYAEKITAERVRRVITGYGTENGTNGNFNFYVLGQPLFLDDGNLNELVGIDKIRKYVFYTETQTPLIEKELKDNEYFLDKHNDTGYYLNYEQDVITTLDHTFLATMKTKAEQYVIYADNCLLTKNYMTKHNIIFKKIPRDITRF